MADLDAELLALAGDSSDDENEQPSEKAPKVNSPPSSTETLGKNTGESPNKSVTGQMSRVTKQGSGQETKSKKVESEEGEASSRGGSPDSLHSAPMSESNSEVSRSGSQTSDTIFPIEGRFYSEKDKTHVMAMSQLEREAILAERADILQRKRQDKAFKQLFKEYTKTSDKKRKASGADIDEGHPRKSSRQKTTLGGRKVGETNDAMEAYKRQREQRGAVAEQRKSDAAARKARKSRGSGSDGSDADADGESEVEWDNNKGKPELPQHEQPPDLTDDNRVKEGRQNFARVCFYPGFDVAIKDCYVRISIGVDEATKEPVYRMAKVKGFAEGKPYAIEGANGISFTTNQYVVAAHGKAEREWPFLLCSMQKITDREFARWKKIMAEENLPTPSKAVLMSKIEDINRLINHQFTEAELQAKLKRSGVLKQKYIALDRHALNARRREAEASEDQDEIMKIDAKIAALQGPKLAFGTSLYKAKDSAPREKTQQERLAEINAASRKANITNVRKAQLRERKIEIAQRIAVSRGEAVANPLARVKIVPKTHHQADEYTKKAKKTDEEIVTGKSAGKEKEATAETPNPEKTSPAKKIRPFDINRIYGPASGSPAAEGDESSESEPDDDDGPKDPSKWVSRAQKDDEVLGNMDFGIDIDVF